jgi:hypothetical protein
MLNTENKATKTPNNNNTDGSAGLASLDTKRFNIIHHFLLVHLIQRAPKTYTEKIMPNCTKS